ncbi:unnamed protein product [Urochloa decumbens]|uniref:DUF569 domain-containing protein n=1 Tax=Urochloa decumbens TaxID=240449 RepID=A0ABC9DUZ9_9POAL
MELFPDGAHVRLRSRVHGFYLYAEEDEVEATWSPDWGSLNAAWAVHRVVRPGGTFFLLRSAAYGRYLRVTSRSGDPSDDFTVAQRSYTTLRKRGFMWEASDSEDGTGDVVLRNRKYGQLMGSWVVEDIPPREDPPELPEVAPTPWPPVHLRRIWYMRAADQAELNALVWSRLWFIGRSVSDLRDELAAALGEADSQNITLCVQAGYRARLTPLVIDLPDNERTMEIVVLTTGSEAAQALVYPDVDAE